MKYACIAAFTLGLVALASGRPIPPSDFLGGWELEVEINIQSKSNTTRPFAEDCDEFCSHTYPQHTYPEPESFKACTAGCRAAQLDAFIAWPVRAEPEKCEGACEEMYSGENLQFACSTGCKTPTVDSAFPNRSHLYKDGNATSEIDILLPPMEDTFSYFLDSFFLPQSPVVFEDLAEHAQNMEMLVVPYRRADVTILTNDGVYTYREYSFDNGDAMAADNTVNPSSHPVYEVPWGNHYHSGSICVWPLRRAVLNRLLMVLSVGLVIAALAMCCLSCGTEGGKKIPPKIASVKTNAPLSTKKAPYDLESEFMLPEKVHLGTYGHKITML